MSIKLEINKDTPEELAKSIEKAKEFGFEFDLTRREELAEWLGNLIEEDINKSEEESEYEGMGHLWKSIKDKANGNENELMFLMFNLGNFIGAEKREMELKGAMFGGDIMSLLRRLSGEDEEETNSDN